MILWRSNLNLNSIWCKKVLQYFANRNFNTIYNWHSFVKCMKFDIIVVGCHGLLLILFVSKYLKRYRFLQIKLSTMKNISVNIIQSSLNKKLQKNRKLMVLALIWTQLLRTTHPSLCTWVNLTLYCANYDLWGKNIRRILKKTFIIIISTFW